MFPPAATWTRAVGLRGLYSIIITNLVGRELIFLIIKRGRRIINIEFIIIIHCLMSDLVSYWTYADYSLYTYREKTLSIEFYIYRRLF